jgi:Spy/CpxP family protein refolding chaperone
MKPALVIALLTAGAAIGIAQAAQNTGGQDMGGFGMGHHHQFMGFLVKELQLTYAQQAQIKTMWKAEKETMKPLMAQLTANRMQMLQLTANGNFPEAKVRELANQNAPLMAQMMVEKEKLMSQVYNQVLTPEQRTKADAMRARHEEHIDRALLHLTGTIPSQE